MTKTNKCAPSSAFKCNERRNDYVLSVELVPVSDGGFAPTAKDLQSQLVDGHAATQTRWKRHKRGPCRLQWAGPAQNRPCKHKQHMPSLKYTPSPIKCTKNSNFITRAPKTHSNTLLLLIPTHTLTDRNTFSYATHHTYTSRRTTLCIHTLYHHLHSSFHSVQRASTGCGFTTA